jgi:hypothetical protein
MIDAAEQDASISDGSGEVEFQRLAREGVRDGFLG